MEKYAYPQDVAAGPLGDFYTSEESGGGGMTLRVYYAGLAMQGLLASGVERFAGQSTAQYAVRYADDLIAALERPPEES